MLRIHLLLLAAIALPAAFADVTLDLEEAERLALERDQSLLAIDARANARLEQSVADGALPDPELMLGSRNQPVDDLAASHEGMAHFIVGARQRFPAGRTRHLQRERGELEATVIHAELDRRRLEVRHAVRNAWLDWRFAHQALVVAGTAESEFEALVELAQRRLATGTARQRDASQARLELAALAERIIELKRDRDAAAAELARWLDEPVWQTPGRAPDWPEPNPGALKDVIADHPVLLELQRRSDASQVETDIANEAYRPSWMMEVGYGFRRASDRMTGESMPDLLTGTVSVSVPLFTGNRQDRRLEAARQRYEASRFEHVDRRRQLQGRIERQMAIWQRHDELAAFYADRLLPESELTRDASLSAYRAGRATFDELVRARVSDLDYRLRELRVMRRRDAARVELLYLAGE